MRLNPEKCTLRVTVRKSLGFYVIERDMEVNPDKCGEVIKMEAPTMKK